MHTTRTFTVPNLRCGHCVHTLKMELGELTSVTGIKAQVDTKQVTVVWQPPAS